MFLPTPFGRLLSSRRLALGLALRDAARRAGLTAVGLGDIERGKRLSLSPRYWPQLAAALQLDLSDLAAAHAADSTVALSPARMPTEAQREAAAALASVVEDLHLASDEQARSIIQAVSRLRVAARSDTATP